MAEQHQHVEVKGISSFSLRNDFDLVCIKTIHSNSVDTPPEHEHRDFYELVIVYGGSGVHRIGGQECLFSAGNVILIPPHQRHCYVRYENLQIYNLLFGEKFVQYFLADLKTLPGFQLLFNMNRNEWHQNPNAGLRISTEKFSEITRILDEMDGIKTNFEPGSKSLLLSDFIRVMVLLAMHVSWAGSPQESRYVEQLTLLLTTLEKHYPESWTLQQMAKTARMGVSSFRKEFRQFTGLPPGEYLLKMRLQNAALLLETSDVPIEEIAAGCGFRDVNYFSRQFARQYHVRPRSFRKRLSAEEKRAVKRNYKVIKRSNGEIPQSSTGGSPSKKGERK